MGSYLYHKRSVPVVTVQTVLHSWVMTPLVMGASLVTTTVIILKDMKKDFKRQNANLHFS
jgi:hypothetical protein